LFAIGGLRKSRNKDAGKGELKEKGGGLKAGPKGLSGNLTCKKRGVLVAESS